MLNALTSSENICKADCLNILKPVLLTFVFVRLSRCVATFLCMLPPPAVASLESIGRNLHVPLL